MHVNRWQYAPSRLTGVSTIYFQRLTYLVGDDDNDTHESAGFWLILKDEALHRSGIDTTAIHGEGGGGVGAWKQRVEASPIWTGFAASAAALYLD